MKFRILKSFLMVAMVAMLSHNANATELSEALEAAYQSNPEIKSAKQSLQGVDEEMPSAISGMMPSVNSSMQRGQRHADIGGSPELNGITDSKSIEITQPLFKGGRTYASIKKANNDILSARERFRNTEQQVLLSAVEAYMNTVRDKEIYTESLKKITFPLCKSILNLPNQGSSLEMLPKLMWPRPMPVLQRLILI